jgi:hypothetical protein
MTRTQQSVITSTESTATHLGWKLVFSHNTGGAETTVTCTGHKPGTGNPPAGGGSLSASLNSSQPGANLNFNGIAYDQQLASDIFAEMQDIIEGGE